MQQVEFRASYCDQSEVCCKVKVSEGQAGQIRADEAGRGQTELEGVNKSSGLRDIIPKPDWNHKFPRS